MKAFGRLTFVVLGKVRLRIKIRPSDNWTVFIVCSVNNSAVAHSSAWVIIAHQRHDSIIRPRRSRWLSLVNRTLRLKLQFIRLTELLRFPWAKCIVPSNFQGGYLSLKMSKLALGPECCLVFLFRIWISTSFCKGFKAVSLAPNGSE